MADDKSEKRPIIIKKILKVHDSRQGVSWKPAPTHYFAAMIPFFLLAWLLAVASPHARKVVGDYFHPQPQASLSAGEVQK